MRASLGSRAQSKRPCIDCIQFQSLYDPGTLTGSADKCILVSQIQSVKEFERRQFVLTSQSIYGMHHIHVNCVNCSPRPNLVSTCNSGPHHTARHEDRDVKALLRLSSICALRTCCCNERFPIIGIGELCYCQACRLQPDRSVCQSGTDHHGRVQLLTFARQVH